MYYIIQSNLFREYHFKTLIEYLDRYKIGYEVVEYKPFVETMDFKTDRKDVWVFGSTNLASSIAGKHGWVPGSMCGPNHDIEIYGKHWAENMLNHDGIIMSILDPVPETLPMLFFSRPTKDTKTFSGQVFTHESWKEWISDLGDSNLIQQVDMETRVQLAPCKTIQQELRCWIIKGKLITCSQYKIGNRVVYQNQDNNEEVKIFVDKMTKIFNPAEAYVMDICLCKDDYKIVEVNCINCSGFYDADMSKLIQGLEHAFNN